MSQGDIASERAVALRVLRRVDGGAYADRALRGEAARAGLDARTHARALRLSYGTVQRQRTLDWLIDGAVNRPSALEPAVRDVLRLGAFELAYSDATPDHAAVDQTVRQARALRGPKRRRAARAGVVNATMRRLAAECGARLAELEDPATPAGLRHSLPDWIAERLGRALGDEAEATMAAFNQPAETALRWNPLRGPRAALERELPPGWRRDPRLPEAYVVHTGFALERSTAWERGHAMAQSRASMIPARALGVVPGERVLDLCAAPGAKATHVVALAQGGVRVTAVELHEARADALRALARRMGARMEVVVGDGREVALGEGFDAALVDPPCSGLGVLSGRPDSRWRRREAAVGPLVELQGQLLARALRAVRPGGRVVYSTCTLLPEENEGVVEAAGVPLDDLSAAFPDWQHPELPGALGTLPGRDGTDGFFVARLRVGSGR